MSGLAAHLAGGLTTLCHAWAVVRRDGVVFGFTDHDLDLSFEGIVFRAGSGLSAMALQQGTGLAVDNTEAVGALSDAAITEADIEAGRFDGAEVRCWRVNWADTGQRLMLFRGSIGELRRAGGQFTAELRGLSEALNRPLGRIYQKPCTAVLGDAACGLDIGKPGYAVTLAAEAVESARLLRFAAIEGFAAGWFQRGRLAVLEGAARGLSGMIKSDVQQGGARVVELWEPMRAPLAAGDLLRLEAGCDKRFETCRLKFANVLNFQGFPDLPGEDWMVAQPAQGAGGGSRR